MKKTKKIYYILFLALLFGLLSFWTVWGSEGTSIHYQYVTDNVEFNLYRIGERKTTGELVLTGDFKDYAVLLTDTSAAVTLDAYAQRDKLMPMISVRTDSLNKAYFNNLERGIYLISGKTVIKNNIKYMATPVLAMVSGNEENNILTINGKFEMETINDNPPGGGTTGSEPDNPKDETSSTSEPDRPSSSAGGSSPTNRRDLSVLKVWMGEGTPEAITVQILRNGDIYDEVILNSENNWRYNWKDINKTDSWTVVEKVVPQGYTVSVNKDGAVFVMTNTAKTYEEDAPDITENTPPDIPDNPDITQDEVVTPGDTADTPAMTDENISEGNDISTGTDTDSGAGVEESVRENITVAEGGSGTEPESESQYLPQTGQLWWPVAVLSCAGLLFLIIGIGKKGAGR